MVVQVMGAAALARLMRPERWPETDWLLFGPEDPEVVEVPSEPAPFAPPPSTERR